MHSVLRVAKKLSATALMLLCSSRRSRSFRAPALRLRRILRRLRGRCKRFLRDSGGSPGFEKAPDGFRALGGHAAAVRGSQRIRTRAMTQSARLASRLPPMQLRRWRCCRPEEASTGETPHSAAKDASSARRSGLSPAATSNAPATSTPTPRSATRTWRGPFHQGIELSVKARDFPVELLPAQRETTQDPLRCGDRVHQACPRWSLDAREINKASEVGHAGSTGATSGAVETTAWS